MVIIDQIYNKAVFTYNVNPYVLIALYILSYPFFYGGYIMMAKIGYRYFKNVKKFDLSGLLSEKGFIKWLVVNRFGWVMPYIYVIILGRNLPIWVYLLIILWLVITTYLIIQKVYKKSSK